MGSKYLFGWFSQRANFRLMLSVKSVAMLLVPILAVLLIRAPTAFADDQLAPLASLIGPTDSLRIEDPAGRLLVSKNDTRRLIPASILKLFTSLVALHYLGPGYRFSTEFFLDRERNLTIKGFGDPLLISEVIDEICACLAARIGPAGKIHDIIVDGSYFNRPLAIPGVSTSTQPYDAPNGALCVNFNTVFFKHTASGYASAEAQTPLLPWAVARIKALGPKNGRIVLSHRDNDIIIYAGKLFAYFLNRHGIQSSGTVKTGCVNPQRDKLIYRHLSSYSLPQIIAKLLEYSNNFTTNQLLITAGIQAFGPPGNLDKGVAAARKYAADVLGITDMRIVEGSGISRANRVSALQMQRVLTRFEPHRIWMRRQGRQYYKTGTLHGIHTRAGYILGADGLYRYVIMCNTPGKTTNPIITRLLKSIK